MYPRRNWDSLNPSPASVCALPPDQVGRGAQCTLACGYGGGRVPIPTTGEKA